MNNENNKEILGGIQTQIGSFDAKATTLLSIVGIVFGLALSCIDVIHQDFFVSKCDSFKCWFTVLLIIFLVSTLFSIFCFVMVIVPRKNKTDVLCPNYYKDINKMDELQLKTAIQNYNDKEDLIIGQIKINSSICYTKHKWLIAGICSFIPFVILLIVMALLLIFA